VQIYGKMARSSRRPASQISPPFAANAEDFYSKESRTRWHSSRLCSSRSRVVLLGWYVRRVKLRKNDKTRNAGECSSSYEWHRQRKTCNVDKIDLKRLTLGETLLISRRRSGLSQDEMARVNGITRNFYGEVERDQSEYQGMNFCEVEPLEVNEKIMLCRRRSSMTQGEIAEQIGITRYWLNQMEVGTAPVSFDLVKFWEDNYAGE